MDSQWTRLYASMLARICGSPDSIHFWYPTMLDPASTISRRGRQVEHLELLDGQRGQPDGEALAHHAVEVDEDPAAQQVVELVNRVA